MSEPPVNPSAPGSSRRPYRSPKRAAAALKTRHAIRDAAETLFLRDGYARTSMKAIAEQAGVSEKTMYLTYATKANLLREVIQVAVRGDESPATLAERPEWRAIMALAESAAASDPELAEHRDHAHATSRADLHALATELKQRGALAAHISAQDAADTMYVLVTDATIYLRLTTECGWTQARYADLIAHTLNATLGPP